jgi:uncharacterized membrane protein
MGKNRLEAFSDGVIAIIITIMVLELKAPVGESLHSLLALFPVFESYLLSFIFVGIYWNNHHHLIHTVKRVNGSMLWANLFLLFWLSLIPFVTGWMGGNRFATVPVACYGVVLLLAAIAYSNLVRVINKYHGNDSLLQRAIGKNWKGKVSLVIYAVAIPVALWLPPLAVAMYLVVAVLWLIPDRRIEVILSNEENQPDGES